MSIYLYMYFLIIRINNGGSIDHLIVGQRVSWVWVRSGGSPNVPTPFYPGDIEQSLVLPPRWPLILYTGTLYYGHRRVQRCPVGNDITIIIQPLYARAACQQAIIIHGEGIRGLLCEKQRMHGCT